MSIKPCCKFCNHEFITCEALGDFSTADKPEHFRIDSDHGFNLKRTEMIMKQILVWLVAGIFFFNVGNVVRAADEKLRMEMTCKWAGIKQPESFPWNDI